MFRALRTLFIVFVISFSAAAKERNVKWYLFDRFEVDGQTYYVSAVSTLPVPTQGFFKKAFEQHSIGPAEERFFLEGDDGEGYLDPRPEWEVLFAKAQEQAKILIRPNRKHEKVPQEFWLRYMEVSPYVDDRSIMTTLWKAVTPWRLEAVTTLLISYKTPDAPLPVEILFGENLEPKFGPYRMAPIHPIRIPLIGKGSSEYEEFSEIGGWGGNWIEMAALTNVLPGGFNFLTYWCERQHLSLIPIYYDVGNAFPVPVYATGFINFAHASMRPFYETYLELPRGRNVEEIWDIYKYDRKTAFNLHTKTTMDTTKPMIDSLIDAWNRQHAGPQQYDLLNTVYFGRGKWLDGCFYRVSQAPKPERGMRRR
jgi:hypothetical protein